MSNRASARALKRLMLKNERVIEADRRFFRRHADRMHRVRLASANEVQMHFAAGTAADHLEPIERLFCVVRSVAVGFRLRAFFPGPAANAAHADDIGETEAAWLFEQVKRARPRIASIEDMMAAALAHDGEGAR